MKKKDDFYSKNRFFRGSPGINASGWRPSDRDRGKIFYTHKLQIGSDIIAKEILSFRIIQVHFTFDAVLIDATLYVLNRRYNIRKEIVLVFLKIL